MDAGTGLNSLKKHVFFEFLNLTGRVFILVRYSDDVMLGNRGFTSEEKENGIILGFIQKMNFLWDDYGIAATLIFGTSPQKCFIPADDIGSIYSPELNAQFIVTPQIGTAAAKKQWPAGMAAESESKDPAAETSKNVIKVDFTKKKKK
jgi:hypothetical protein